MNPVGRPSTYSPEIADAICRELMIGKSLRAICDADGFPAISSIFLWIQQHKDFSEQYARAREIQAEVYADDIIHLADECRTGEKVTVKGDGKVETVTGDMVERSKLQVDARKWIAARLLPKKFGDKVSAEVSGKDGGPITFTLRRVGTTEG